MPDVTLTAEEARELLKMLKAAPPAFAATDVAEKLRKAAGPRKFSDYAWVHDDFFRFGFDGGHYLLETGGDGRIRVLFTIEEIV